jgi:hypothetical protein
MLRYVVCIGIGFFLTISSIYGQSETSTTQDVEAPFNMSDIIERVSHHPIKIGNTIVIKDRVYEAFFDDDGVILKARETRGDAKDLVIPISSIPEIRDGKVIYKLEGGEIVFEGNTRGLRFHHTVNNRFDLNYTGNVAKLCYSNSHHHDQNKSCEKSMVSAQRYQRQSDNGVRDGEFLIDTNIVYIVDTNWQVSPSVAFDGVNYLVVWHDDRNGYYFDIYGTRINQAGVVLDSLGIEISTVSGDQFVPSVAFDGTNYLVVWVDASGLYCDIYGSRVSRSGVVLDPSGIAICTAEDHQYDPLVAFDGTNYLVVWQDWRSGDYFDIYGTRVSQSGVVLDLSGIAISTADYSQFNPRVAFDGTNYLVVWEDWRSGTYDYDIYGARVTQTGTVLDPGGIAISTKANWERYPSVTFDGTNYLVVWDEKRSVSSDIYGSRVSQTGIVLDPEGIAISTGTGDQFASSIAFDGTNYLVVWEDYNSGSSDIYGARVNQDGLVLDPVGIAITTALNEQLEAHVVFDGNNYLVVWQDYRNDPTEFANPDVYGTRVNQSGVVLDPSGIALAYEVYYQWYPSVAFDGTNYLVVWEDYRSGSSDIYGARVNQSGIVLDPDCIAIATEINEQWYPSVAFDGTNYLVVWQDKPSGSSDIYGVRVSQSGVVLDLEGIAISTETGSQGYPSVAFDGTNYLAVWEDRRSGSYDIYGARVSLTGTVLDPTGITISAAENAQRTPSITFDGANYLVVWADGRSGSSADLYGAEVNVLGTVVDSFAVSVQTGNQLTPALVHGQGDQLLVVYCGFVDYINTHAANTLRIWGKFFPIPGIEENISMPNIRTLLKIYPNPFNQMTEIRCQITDDRLSMTNSRAQIKIYNVSGQVIKSFNLTPDVLPFTSVISWDGTNAKGQKVPAGVYFCSLETDGFTTNQKIIKTR